MRKPSEPPPSRIRNTIFAVLALILAACQRPLPEAGSPAANLYVARCGACHRPFDPGSLTAPMWQIKVKMMEGNMRLTGMSLTDEERATILDYLTRNAHKD